MKNQFAWYFASSPEAASEAWNTGYLSIDANVLLDLYRYHPSTRDELLNALETFKGRIWLSRQAADEFFRNRKRVIASAEATFKEADEDFQKILNIVQNEINNIKRHRLVSRAEIDLMLKSITAAIKSTRESISQSAAEHPNYLVSDPILERIIELFGDSIGQGPNNERKVELLKQGKKRHDEKIPPGYMDDKKDGPTKYGDFFIWNELIDFAKAGSTPIIYVTSDNKEDWWEIKSGKTLGPRPELLSEFWAETGKFIYIYQRDRFSQRVNETAGEVVSSASVEEIQRLNAPALPAASEWSTALSRALVANAKTKLASTATKEERRLLEWYIYLMEITPRIGKDLLEAAHRIAEARADFSIRKAEIDDLMPGGYRTDMRVQAAYEAMRHYENKLRELKILREFDGQSLKSAEEIFEKVHGYPISAEGT